MFAIPAAMGILNIGSQLLGLGGAKGGPAGFAQNLLGSLFGANKALNTVGSLGSGAAALGLANGVSGAMHVAHGVNAVKSIASAGSALAMLAGMGAF